MNYLDLFVALKYAADHPEENVWTDWDKSGIDYQALPALEGSGLEPYFRHTSMQGAPISDDTEIPFLLFLLFLVLSFFQPWEALERQGALALQVIKAQGRPRINSPSWEEMVALLEKERSRA
ncbi:MAG: hypothetical protein K2X82_17875 [Gemmataceae bacterium]|nr:hypothetical protein [Gemmataceae bacterium]